MNGTTKQNPSRLQKWSNGDTAILVAAWVGGERSMDNLLKLPYKSSYTKEGIKEHLVRLRLTVREKKQRAKWGGVRTEKILKLEEQVASLIKRVDELETIVLQRLVEKANTVMK